MSQKQLEQLERREYASAGLQGIIPLNCKAPLFLIGGSADLASAAKGQVYYQFSASPAELWHTGHLNFKGL